MWIVHEVLHKTIAGSENKIIKFMLFLNNFCKISAMELKLALFSCVVGLVESDFFVYTAENDQTVQG